MLMSVDFRQLQEQVRSLGLEAVKREQVIRERRQLASDLLEEHAKRWQALRHKVQQIVDQVDPNLRCALPVEGGAEALNHRRAAPAPLARGTVIAADGSQINPDRHAEVEFCLVNVGAIQLRIGSADPPVSLITSDLIYGDRLQTPGGTLTEAHVALMRDTAERNILAKLSAAAPEHPLITFTDGPLELWGAKDGDAAEFGRRLEEYQQALASLRDLGAATAGYVDSPTANLVIRLLEVAMTPEEHLGRIRDYHPLQGATDLWLFSHLLVPGERSAVFAIQSGSMNRYRGDLSLHFFYLHTGRGGRPLARVEIPAWVAGNPELVDALHATLVQQCQVLGTRAYPYLLHRAHEVALVSLAEKEQVTHMIMQERLRRGLDPGEKSHKQSVKDLPGRTRY
jgi:hypothetical protein